MKTSSIVKAVIGGGLVGLPAYVFGNLAGYNATKAGKAQSDLINTEIALNDYKNPTIHYTLPKNPSENEIKNNRMLHSVIDKYRNTNKYDNMTIKDVEDKFTKDVLKNYIYSEYEPGGSYPEYSFPKYSKGSVHAAYIDDQFEKIAVSAKDVGDVFKAIVDEAPWISGGLLGLGAGYTIGNVQGRISGLKDKKSIASTKKENTKLLNEFDHIKAGRDSKTYRPPQLRVSYDPEDESWDYPAPRMYIPSDLPDITSDSFDDEYQNIWDAYDLSTDDMKWGDYKKLRKNGIKSMASENLSCFEKVAMIISM